MSTVDQKQLAAITKARNYFQGIRPAAAADEDYDPNIEDSDGFVSYILPIANQAPPDLMNDILVLGGKLQSLIGIVTAAVLATSGEDTAKLHQFDTWFEPFSYIGEAWFGQFKSVDRTEDRTIEGVEVSTAFLEILLDAAVNEGAAMADFQKFLRSQGETMRLEVEDDGQGYKYASLGIAHEVFQLPDGTWIYVPKLRCFWTEFTKETFEITSGCVSVDHYRFNFAAKSLVGVFNYQLWKDSKDYRDQLDDFIDGLQRARIEKSKNYFEGVFASRRG
jgi:hypothetical protein